MSTIVVKDGNGTNQTAALVTNTGPQTAAESLSVVPSSDGFAVTGPLTDAQLRAAAVPVTGPLTDTQLRASAVPVSGTIALDAGTLAALETINALTGGLTDAQLRAAAVAISGTVAVSNFPVTQPVSGPLTDAELRAAAVPVSGPLTDAQLRAAAVPVSAAALPLPTGAATETTLAALNTKTPALGQAAMAASQPVVVASDQSIIPVNQAGVSATGTLGALNATVALSLTGATGFAVDLRGTFTATVTFQGTVDGTNWFTLAVLPAGSAANIATVTTATAAGAWMGNANGCQQVRAIATAYTSGTVNVTLRAMQAVGMVYNLPGGQTTQAVSGTVTANIGTGSLAAGTNAIGDVGIQYRANATGAASVVSALSPATPAAGTIKATAGRLIGWQLQNGSAGLRSVKLFNATAPTLGTTSAVFEIDIPAGGRSEVQLPGGIGFATAITWSATSAKGLTDNTATGLAANDVSGAFFFA